MCDNAQTMALLLCTIYHARARDKTLVIERVAPTLSSSVQPRGERRTRCQACHPCEWGHAIRVGREKRAGVLEMELAVSMLFAFVAGAFVGVLLMAMLFMARGDDDATMERGNND